MSLQEVREPSVTIVVLTYNRRACLHKLLRHLREASSYVHEIILVDNASTDGTENLVAKEFPEVLYLRNETNLGACGRNRGMKEARGDIIVTLDDDVFGLGIKELETISQSFLENPSLGVLNFHVADYFTGKTCNWMHHCSAARAQESFMTYEISEGAAAFRTAALRRVGYYWEPFFIGQEGLDLAFRMMDKGYQIQYDGRIVVKHRFEPQARANWRFYYFDTRNIIWLACRRMRWPIAMKYLGVGLSSMACYSIRDGFAGWWLKAIVDGLRGLSSAWQTRQVMRHETEETIKAIDRERPPFWEQVRRRLLQPANRLDG